MLIDKLKSKIEQNKSKQYRIIRSQSAKMASSSVIDKQIKIRQSNERRRRRKMSTSRQENVEASSSLVTNRVDQHLMVVKDDIGW